MFLDEVMNEIKNHIFYFDILLAATVMFFWFRFLIMLRLTEKFGPLIEIILKMLTDMIIFFGLFIIELIMFASIGILIFPEIPEYDNIFSAILYILSASLG